jgi:hypothetical protein
VGVLGVLLLPKVIVKCKFMGFRVYDNVVALYLNVDVREAVWNMDEALNLAPARFVQRG